MGAVFGLLVGIDRYRSPDVPRLRGCRTDITDAKALLSSRSADPRIAELCDESATRTAIVDAFRTHLGQAGPGDTALFWFSGHGSQAPVPEPLWHLEPNGRMLQTLVCHDSRYQGTPDLLDKELALLLDEVAASGCHTVAVLDSCHAGGATRGPVRVRAARPLAAIAVDQLLPELSTRYAAGAPPVRHVALAACSPAEAAGEQEIDGAHRGLFTWALLRALSRAETHATYRQLLLLARNELDHLPASQRPQLRPLGPGPGDQPFLGGGSTGPPPSLMMRHGRAGWEIDGGAGHGIETDRLVMVVGDPPVREARVTRAETHRSLVAPIAWRPDPSHIYPVVIGAQPAPSTTIAVTSSVADELRAALTGADLRWGDGDLLLGHGPDGRLQLTERDHGPVHAWTDRVDAHRIVQDLTHIVRFREVRGLANTASALRGAVSVEIVEPLPAETLVSPHRHSLALDTDGAIDLSYRREGGAWLPPARFIRIRNTSSRPLYCVLLELTDRFEIHGDLFRSERVEPGAVAATHEGAPVKFALPYDRPLHPGAEARNWLKLIVADDEITTSPFELPRIGSTWRDLHPTSLKTTVGDWWTLTVQVTTRVP